MCIVYSLICIVFMIISFSNFALISTADVKISYTLQPLNTAWQHTIISLCVVCSLLRPLLWHREWRKLQHDKHRYAVYKPSSSYQNLHHRLANDIIGQWLSIVWSFFYAIMNSRNNRCFFFFKNCELFSVSSCIQETSPFFFFYFKNYELKLYFIFLNTDHFSDLVYKIGLFNNKIEMNIMRTFEYTFWIP